MNVKVTIIAQDLAKKIKHNIYPIGSFLPSEHQLMELYGASRETVRKALEELLSLGIIQKIKGKGSIVLDYSRYALPISGITSFAELNQTLGMQASTQVLTFEKCTHLPDTFKKFFPEEKNSTGFHLERLRIIDNLPEVLDCDYLLDPPINDLPQKAAEGSLYKYLEDELKLNISYATKEITILKATQRIKDLLQLDENLVVLVASRNYLADTTKFELTLSFHRPDKFRFVDFARRKKINI